MNPVTRFIARRLGAQIPETPARDTSSRPVAGQAGGGDLLPASVGQPVAGMSPASPVAQRSPDGGGGSPYVTHPDPVMEQFVRDEERKAR